MISKETYDKIQEYKETGLSILKATQKLGISYNTTYRRSPYSGTPAR